MNVISVIVGSTREGRFSEKPAHWIFQHLKKREGVDARLLDLRDFPMPFFDQPVTPATPGRPAFKNEVVQRWTAAIAQSDGFVFVTPEYNYGPPAVLKNAIDWVYPEWHRKAVCFVSYGSAAGVRSVQQLRESVIETSTRPDPLIMWTYRCARNQTGKRAWPCTEHSTSMPACGTSKAAVVAARSLVGGHRHRDSALNSAQPPCTGDTP